MPLYNGGRDGNGSVRNEPHCMPKGTAMLCVLRQRAVMCDLSEDKRVPWPLRTDLTKLDWGAIVLVETR